MSSRAVAQRFGVSYQTAHRLLQELQAEGLLQRRAASGTFLPGERVALRGVQLIFHPRARRKGSFGAHLVELIEARLREEGVAWVRNWCDDGGEPRLRSDFYPVVWESRPALQQALEKRRFALLLNDRPPPGLRGTFIDAVTTDDFSGGACAAELLKLGRRGPGGFAVLGGPLNDQRSVQRIAGFRAHAEIALLMSADSWFVEAGRKHAPALLAGKPAGIFACNDRLAQAVIDYACERQLELPPLIGFDNAPVAERLRLTTIGIPWDAFVSHAVEIIKTRLTGNSGTAKLVSISHEPILRLTSRS
jgi:hypothetical protein